MKRYVRGICGVRERSRGYGYYGVTCEDLKKINEACDRLMTKYDWVKPDVEKTSPKRRRVTV